LEASALYDTQINLHAFFANVYGLFDNCAWAFVYRHQLDDLIRDRRRVGMFNSALACHLPKPIMDVVETSRPWFDDYLRGYRDALAHRIPVYIPPSELSPGDGERFNALEREKIACLRTHDFDRINAIGREQAALSRPSFMFVGSHSIGEDEKPESQPLYLHP
jgi:hypothetical protein